MKEVVIIRYELNQKQQDLVTQNIGLVYDFIYQCKNINEYSTGNNIDYFGIAMEALCLAAYTYDAQKSNFSTYAYKCMESKYISAKNSEFIERKIPTYLLVSLDIIDDEYELDNFYGNFEKQIEIKDIYSRIRALLTDMEQIIFSYYLCGYTMREIAYIIKCSHQNIYKIINRCKKKIKEYFQYTNIYQEYC